MAGTIDSAVERKRDEDPKKYADKQRDLEGVSDSGGPGEGDSSATKEKRQHPRESDH